MSRVRLLSLTFLHTSLLLAYSIGCGSKATDNGNQGASGGGSFGGAGTETGGSTSSGGAGSGGATGGASSGGSGTGGDASGGTQGSGGGAPELCGNDQIDDGEDCDGDALGENTCSSLEYDGGTLSCSASCSWDTSECITIPVGWICLRSFFADGNCDCGCGEVDADCDDNTVSACDYCDSGCGETDCPGSIDPANNAACLD
jgi:hypothetical protein